MTLFKNFKISNLLLICLIASIIIACEKETVEPKSEYLSFPIGRSFLNTSTVTAIVNGKTISPDILDDSCGGFWLQFDVSNLKTGDSIAVRFVRKKEELKLFHDESETREEWSSPSYFIDSDNETLTSKALEITDNLSTIEEKADAIRQFVTQHIEYIIYPDSFLELSSTSYELAYGTCMNYSRLFVAMCRAVDIPARSVWGVVYGANNDQVYDYHHQWAEVKDEEGYWHPCDFGYTRYFDLNDIRYLDLIYGAEENTICEDHNKHNFNMFDIRFIEGYPVTYTGRLGFDLKNNHSPDSMIVEYSFKYY